MTRFSLLDVINALINEQPISEKELVQVAKFIIDGLTVPELNNLQKYIKKSLKGSE